MTAQDGIHEIEEIAENTWRIDEGGFVNCYLLAGKTGALLIDTGIGAGRLRETVESLTKLPVTVVLTHGHCDHAGGTGWYPSYFIHPADRAFIYRVMSSGLAVKMLMNGVKKQYGKSSAGAASGGQPEAGQQTDMVLPEITKKPYHSKAVSLSGNQCFDLGSGSFTPFQCRGTRAVPWHSKKKNRGSCLPGMTSTFLCGCSFRDAQRSVNGCPVRRDCCFSRRITRSSAGMATGDRARSR
jgi:hypothetical protein